MSKLKIFKCGCGYGTLLERPYCPKCHELLRPDETEARGIVLSWTVVYVTAHENEPPIGIAMVGLSSGINAMTRFDPSQKVEVGDRVEVELRDGLRHISQSSSPR